MKGDIMKHSSFVIEGNDRDSMYITISNGGVREIDQI